MSTASPTAFLLWAILSVLFFVFLFYHLWSYDKFKCLRWSAGRQPGAFKRVMTYSYLGSVPLFVLFSVATTVIKFKEGFIMTEDNKIIPKPLDAYSPHSRSWIIPLDFVFSIAWSLELVTHLEELAFWLYLLHQNPQKSEWFSSWEYRFWYLGSMVAIMGMPLTALITRKDINTCDAYIFLVGSAGSTLTTICFLYVLWRFPRFIDHVKSDGADPSVVVRLATFYQLNLARVVFRFLFTVPLLVVALDGIIVGSHVISHSLFWADFLLMIAGIGCFVSTTITLLIFFPRSIVKEAGYKPKISTSAANSPKSAVTTPPSLSSAFAPSPQPSNLTGHPVVLPPLATPAETDEWDGISVSPSDTSYYPDPDQAPPYPQSQPPPHQHVSMQLHSQPHEHHTQIQFHHRLQEQVAYQRHPFPHSLSSPQIIAPSSPQILSPPTSPPQIRDIAVPPSSPRRHYRHQSRRVSVPQPSIKQARTEVGIGLGVGIGTPQFDDSGQDSSMQTLRGVSRAPTAGLRPASSLHPYVMTFTSPIDLADIPIRDQLPRTM